MACTVTSAPCEPSSRKSRTGAERLSVTLNDIRSGAASARTTSVQPMNLGRAGRRMDGACGRIGEENGRRDSHPRSVHLEASLQIPTREEIMRDEGARSGREHHARDENPDP